MEEFKEEGEGLWYAQQPKKGPRDEEMGDAIVEKIVKHRKNNLGRVEFLVKWVGWSDEHNTWEHPGNLLKCSNGLITYCAENCIALDALDLVPHPF